jgi:hypothetical protein
VDKKLFFISARTTEAVKQALKAEAGRQRRTESEVLHVIVCQYLGLDPYDDGSEDPNDAATGIQPAAGI